MNHSICILGNLAMVALSIRGNLDIERRSIAKNGWKREGAVPNIEQVPENDHVYSLVFETFDGPSDGINNGPLLGRYSSKDVTQLTKRVLPRRAELRTHV